MATGIQLVAQRIKQLRFERAWPQEQLADICDVSVRTVQRVEHGETFSLETLKALAAAFD
jgi:transcriptional regulator with XRE-family HTH domain|tara:strand:+ start:334 stop:513 length:180 start_codon:yes stop_codon:yes gene_type:complete